MSTGTTENAAVPAWGGIGGTGRHASEAIADLASQPRIAELVDQLPKVAWGGIGGSGRHAQELTPEVAPTPPSGR